MNSNSVEILRKEIDKLHQELFVLFERRCQLTTSIWKIKQEQGQPFHNSEREAQIIEDFVQLQGLENSEPLKTNLYKNLMKSILKEYETYLNGCFKVSSQSDSQK